MKKQKFGTYWTTINIDIFRAAVLVLVSKSRKDILKDLPKIYAEFSISRKDIQRDIQEIKQAFDVDEYMPLGYTIRLANPSGDVLMMFNADTIADVSEENIVHETHHASHFLCTFRGVEDEECEAYLQEYLFNRLLSIIDDWNDSHKKKSK